MDSGYNGVNLELRQTEAHPLLMDQNSTCSHHDHVSTVIPASSEGSDQYVVPISSLSAGCRDPSTGASSTAGLSSELQLSPSAELLRRPGSFENQSNGSSQSVEQRRGNFGSGLWVQIEMMLTAIQILASIVVLSISRNEKPKAPLSLWVVGYTAGCLASLPLLYWRLAHRPVQQSEDDPLALSVASTSSVSSSPNTSRGVSRTNLLQSEDIENGRLAGNQVQTNEVLRIDVYMGRFKVMLECFFAVWFVVGNIWIFGGHSSYHDAPNLYRLCIAFLTFSCIGYAMPFVICSMVCCCLPCIITLLGYRDDRDKVKGATPEVIQALPVYKFKTKHSEKALCKDASDSDGESSGDEGIFAAGTDGERLVSSEDAVCCICLGKYKNGVDLKALPCSHFFHVECVDKWLTINGSCPLCKHELTRADPSEQPVVESGAQTNVVHESIAI